MKKMKLFAPLLGSTITLASVVPAVACTYKDPEAKYYTVSVSSDKFTLTNKKEAKELEAYETDVTWREDGFIVNTAKVIIKVGGKTLQRGDFTYTNDGKNLKLGHLKINSGVIDGNVVITLYLLDIRRAPISLVNISDDTRTISVTSETGDVEVGTDLTLKVDWPESPVENQVYFANLVSIFIGTKHIYQKSADEPNGFTLSDYTGKGLTISLPKENIRDNTEIIIAIDLELSNYDTLVQMNTFASHYCRYKRTGEWYDVLKSQGDPKSGDWSLLKVTTGQVVEFTIDLSKWSDDTTKTIAINNEDLIFTIGSWSTRTTEMTMFDLTAGAAGNIWYGNKKVEFEIDSLSNTAIIFHAPDGGWGETAAERGIISGWYQFAGGHSNVQFLCGLLDNREN